MSDDNAERNTSEERVVRSVLQRIAAAPRHQIVLDEPLVARSYVDLAAWRVPALAAALLIMCISGALILKADVPPPDQMIVSRPDDLPAPVRRYLETGQVSPMDWLNTYGGNR